jgi:pilus assembly protein CpaF
MEKDLTSFRNDIISASSKKNTGKRFLSYEEGIEEMKEKIQELVKERDMALDLSNKKKNRTKADLREIRKLYTNLAKESMLRSNITIREYETPEGVSSFIEEFVEEIIGYSIIRNAMEDNRITDIFINSWDNIILEGYDGYRVYDKKFRNEKHLFDFMSRLLREAGDEINDGDKKIRDFELYGDRYCAISKTVANKGYSLTVRKHFEKHITLEQIINGNVMTQKMAKLMLTIMKNETNVIIAGKTGSGKTTTMRALIEQYSAETSKRILVCEDTTELNLRTEHALALNSVRGDKSGAANVITLLDLIYTALRQKPAQIVVGEVRGEEAKAAVEAMETGHSTIFSMHGQTAWDIINRLTTKYISTMPALGREVVERIIGTSIDYVCMQNSVDGKKRVTSIDEISYDFENNRIIVKNIVNFDFFSNKFVWENKLSKEKVKKMLKNGASIEEVREFSEE